MKKLIFACLVLSSCTFKAPAEYSPSDFHVKEIKASEAKEKFLSGLNHCGTNYGLATCAGSRCNIFLDTNNMGNKPMLGYVQFKPYGADVHTINRYVGHSIFPHAWESFIKNEGVCP